MLNRWNIWQTCGDEDLVYHVSHIHGHEDPLTSNLQGFWDPYAHVDFVN